MTSPLVLCTACNQAYAMGAAVAVVSALRHLDDDAFPVQVYVLDGGMRESSWRCIVRSIGGMKRNVRLVRLNPDMTTFQGLPRDWGSSVMTYARLALPWLLDERRVLYFDADLFFQADPGWLAESEMDGNIIAAVPNVITRTLGCENLPLNDFNLSAEAPYLQAGLLLMDMDEWRRERVSERILEYLRKYPQYSRYWDQSAINVICYRRWKMLPQSWNTPAWWADEGRDSVSIDNPVIHFVGPHKPWIRGYHRTPTAVRFFELLDSTAWKGWRPSYMRFALKRIKYELWKRTQRKWTARH